ncbi:E3 ubiquitin-protein ligase RSL1-like [Bidens hawaiensis]|uniref:E3 ubiquitin-protein ligase RSL1-like n=1 Tax=Bidens hawaiensis TaxID=980011 RepID=UPI00404A44B6
MKQHVEVKLLSTGVLPKCRHKGCANALRIERCEKFLNPKFSEMMRQRVKEESIPVTEKVYCPYPKCSMLIQKIKLWLMKLEVVPWHKYMNCEEYKRRNPTQLVEESKLKSLAARNLWRQCIKCKHMIELAAGCYHMTCRFCNVR